MIDSAEMGRRLTTALDRAGLSKGEAARRLGVPRPRIAEWCRGKWMPSAARLLWIVANLGLDRRTIAPEWTEQNPVRDE